MADTPPPMDFEDEKEAPDDEDLQSPFLDPETSAMDEIQPSQVADFDLNASLNEDESEELPLESMTVEEKVVAPPPTLEAQAADEEEVRVQPKLIEPVTNNLDLFDDPQPVVRQTQKSLEETEDEGGDTFELTITVSNPEKVGDGMSAYISYTVNTVTTMPKFKNPECSVRRRFSDFLGLHQKMTENHMAKGRIVPPAPEKSVMGMTKVKFSKSEDNNALFIERRRASLERYLNRLARHPVLRKDDDLKDFLENPSELPKATDTGALSGAGFIRLMKNVGDSFAKMTGKKADTDIWFDEQQSNFEALDSHLKKLNQAIETMINCRKELCSNTGVFVKSVATLGNVEENNSVSRALSRLSEVEEKIESLHQDQANKDLFVFGETVKDYISLLGSIKESFNTRGKLRNVWQSAQVTLAKKRETEVKLQAGGKPEKIAQNKQEIEEWEGKMEESQKNFEDISQTLRKEVERFEAARSQEFKDKFVSYLESMMQMQQELIHVWEGYLPDAKAIA